MVGFQNTTHSNRLKSDLARDNVGNPTGRKAVHRKKSCSGDGGEATSVDQESFHLLLWNREKAIQTATDFLIKDPQARVCARLLTLCGVRVGTDLPKEPVELPLTQDQFAMMCGQEMRCHILQVDFRSDLHWFVGLGRDGLNSDLLLLTITDSEW